MNGQGPLTLSALTHFPLCVFKCLAIPAPGVKEDAEDSPLSQALYHCFQRLDKDRSRGNITAEEWLRLREKAQELYHTAVTAKTRHGDGTFRSHAGFYIEILWKLDNLVNPKTHGDALSKHQHDRRVEHVGIMGELYAALVLLRDHFDVAQAQAAVVGLAGDISPVHFLDLIVKAIVHGDGQHLAGAKHVELDEPLVSFSAVCGVNGVLQQVAQDHG